MTVPNPYESPIACPANEVFPRQQALKLVWWPALAMFSLSAKQLIALTGLWLILVEMLRVSPVPPSTYLKRFWLLSSTPSCILILIGAWRMRDLRWLRVSQAAALIACIPYATPFVWIGVPFGIWATFVLFRKDVAAEFDRP